MGEVDPQVEPLCGTLSEKRLPQMMRLSFLAQRQDKEFLTYLLLMYILTSWNALKDGESRFISQEQGK